MRMAYATDVSVYQERPVAVALPKTIDDIKSLIQFIAASGTSCRHQIKDGTGRKAKHTVEILYEAIIKSKDSTA
jgi:hypothetical protein